MFTHLCCFSQSGTPSPVNLVFIHDMFDTCEASQIFMRQVCRESGRQGLVWNYPGQAFTKYSDDSVLSNDFYADCLAELLRSVSASGEFCLDASFPVNVVGIGFGGSIALSFASRHAASFRGCLSGITLVNSFAHVDSQLAAILHSSVNVFSCFPATKPDLPLTYFSRFLFSEAFITKVSVELCVIRAHCVISCFLRRLQKMSHCPCTQQCRTRSLWTIASRFAKRFCAPQTLALAFPACLVLWSWCNPWITCSSLCLTRIQYCKTDLT